jgi:hypothetical protein
MALIIRGRTACAICGAVLSAGDDIFATSGGPIQPSDPLCKFQDAGMHRHCFQEWPLREAFRAKYNNFFKNHLRGMRYIHEDGTVEKREPNSGKEG